MDPIILFFLSGIFLGVVKSDFRMPKAVYELLTIILLLSIGLKGGVELAKQPFLHVVPQLLGVVLLGVFIPLVLYPILKLIGKFNKVDAACIAAHYGSVSVGTFAVALSFLADKGVNYEPYVPLFVVMLEIPAVIVGILLAKGFKNGKTWTYMVREILLGKGVALLLIGLFVGFVSGHKVESIAPLFFDSFKGVLALFLLEMGLIAAEQLGSLKKYGLFLIIFGIATPLVMGGVGVVLGKILGLSFGGSVILGTLAASASYIAVPAAFRLSVPEANLSLALVASLGITFTFNVLLGIPIYYKYAILLS